MKIAINDASGYRPDPESMNLTRQKFTRTPYPEHIKCDELPKKSQTSSLTVCAGCYSVKVLVSFPGDLFFDKCDRHTDKPAIVFDEVLLRLRDDSDVAHPVRSEYGFI